MYTATVDVVFCICAKMTLSSHRSTFNDHLNTFYCQSIFVVGINYCNGCAFYSSMWCIWHIYHTKHQVLISWLSFIDYSNILFLLSCETWLLINCMWCIYIYIMLIVAYLLPRCIQSSVRYMDPCIIQCLVWSSSCSLYKGHSISLTDVEVIRRLCSWFY